MIDSTFFYAGLGVFTMMILGLVLTVLEFRKLSLAEELKAKSK